ncbi:MAG: phosphoenolpyruvate-utilizing N-terminal domain-containing protein [Lachnospiraceae bacterium]|nr:phosphoenolpyruvate-utilizing N-terminal domain-containing protein [Lachnospiraceae bacterium]
MYDQIITIKCHMIDVKVEIDKLNKAIERVSDHLDGMYEIALDEFGEKNADIFLAQKMLLNDASFFASMCKYIDEGMNASDAVEKTSKETADKLLKVPDESIQAKALDIEELSKRLINVINGHIEDYEESASSMSGTIDGDNLTTADILLLDIDKVTEIIFDKTSEFAHTVILAKARGFNIRFTSKEKSELVCNIGKLTKIDTKKILRTEYIYMNRKKLPSVEEQTVIYSDYIRREYTAGSSLPIIRIFDLGGDKTSALMPDNETSIFSKRGIRKALENEKILVEQICAIISASEKEGKVGILVPMITTETEAKRVEELIRKTYESMHESGYFDIDFGLMIETPAAVMISDKLSKMCDFLMIGVNDLMQYTYACDRGSRDLENIYNENPDAILNMIDIVKKNAEATGIDVAICGI